MTVTERAAEKALSILTQEGKGDHGLRVYVAGTGCCGPSYGINIQETQMPNDEVVEKNGLKVYVDKDLFNTLSGMELDYYSDENAEGFIFTGATMSCGSGCDSSGCGSG